MPNKKKIINEDYQHASNSNEKEIIFVDLSDDEKIVYSQLGINPLIKLGKEYINTNTIAKLKKKEKNISINKKSNKKISNSKVLKDSEVLNQSMEINNNKNILDDHINENKEVKESLDNNSDNEADISRRTRRRSSASSE